MSLAVQTNYNDRIKAGIDVVGISNFVSFLKNTQGYRRDLRRAEYGDERDPEMRRFLEQVSPLTHAEQDPDADPDRPGPERPAGAALRVRADGRRGAEERRAGLVRRRHERGPRLRQEGQPGLPPGRRGRVPPALPAGARREAGREAAPRCPVRGTIHLNGKPLDSAVIVFTPVDPKGRKARGEVKDGKFRLTTVGADDGAVPGGYKVTIEPIADRQDGKRPAVPAQYANPETTSLRATVAPAVTVLDFRIESHDPAAKGDRR